MKHTNRYVYVMTLGMASGVGFVNAYEVEDLNLRADADLPEPELIEARRGNVNSNWTKTAVRLSEAFRRVVHQPLWRKAIKPSVTA